MEISGKIIQVLEAQQGNSAKGSWKRQDFILETSEQYPKKVCISNWNDKVDLNAFPIGTGVKIGINLESREYNGKWYTDVRAWKMDALDGKSSSSNPDTNSFANEAYFDEVNDLPF